MAVYEFNGVSAIPLTNIGKRFWMLQAGKTQRLAAFVINQVPAGRNKETVTHHYVCGYLAVNLNEKSMIENGRLGKLYDITFASLTPPSTVHIPGFVNEAFSHIVPFDAYVGFALLDQLFLTDDSDSNKAAYERALRRTADITQAIEDSYA